MFNGTCGAALIIEHYNLAIKYIVLKNNIGSFMAFFLLGHTFFKNFQHIVVSYFIDDIMNSPRPI